MPRRKTETSMRLPPKMEREFTDQSWALWCSNITNSEFATEEEKREAWRTHGERIIREYELEHPGQMPPGFHLYGQP